MNNGEIQIHEDSGGIVIQAPQLRVAASYYGPVTVAHLSGRLVLGRECEALQYATTVLAERGRNRVLLDLGELRYIDSPGLGALVMAVKAIETRGGSICFSNSIGRISNLLQLTRIAAIAPIHELADVVPGLEVDSRDDAL